MALLSFLEQNDLSGKERVPVLFSWYRRSGQQRGTDYRGNAGGRSFRQHFCCYEEDAASSEEDIRDWVNGLGYSQPEDADGSAAASLQEMQPLTVEEAE